MRAAKDTGSARREFEKADVDRAEPEAAGAIDQIIIPHPLEPRIETKWLDLWPRRLEARPPILQRPRIAFTKRLIVRQLQSRPLGLFPHLPHCRQHAAREDELLNEVGPPPVALEQGVFES